MKTVDRLMEDNLQTMAEFPEDFDAGEYSINPLNLADEYVPELDPEGDLLTEEQLYELLVEDW